MGTPPYTYEWDFGDGSPVSTEATPTHTFTTAGDYSVTVLVIDGNSRGASGLTTVSVVETLGVTASAAPTTGTTPVSVIFAGSVTGGLAPFTYSWDFGNGETSTSANPTYTYTLGGDFTASLTVTDSIGQTAVSAPIALSFAQGLLPRFSASTTMGTVPLTVSFTDQTIGGSPPYAYTWAFGDGSSSSSANPTHTYLNAGTYSVILTVRDGSGTTRSSDPTSILVNPVLVVSFTASPTVGPSPLTVAFTPDVTGGLPPYEYAWDFGDGGTSAGVSPTHTYTQDGGYTARLTVTDAALVSKSYSLTLYAAPLLVAGFTADTVEGREPLSVDFTNTTIGGEPPLVYSWNFGDGSGVDPRPSPSHSFRVRGTYTVTQTVTDAIGQISTATTTITVKNSTPTLLWRATIPALVIGYPTVDPDGYVYAAADNTRVYRIAPDGQVQWANKPGGVVMGAMAFNQGMLYIPVSTREMVAYSTSGNKVWSVKLDGQPTSAAVASCSGNLFFGTDNGEVYGVNPGGAVMWKMDTGGPVTTPPALGHDGTLYVMANGGVDDFGLATPAIIYALAPGTGAIRWGAYLSLDINDPTVSAVPLVLDEDDNLYVTDSTSGTLASIDTTQIAFNWFATGGAASPVIAGDTVLVSDSGNLEALDRLTGITLWSQSVGGAETGYTPAVSSDGKVFVWDSELYSLQVLDLTSGEIIASRDTSGRGRDMVLFPRGLNGRLVFFTGNSNVECFQVNGGPANGPWPQYGGSYNKLARRDDPPTVSLDYPGMGDLITGNVTIAVSGSDDWSCANTQTSVYLDNYKTETFKSTPATYTWYSGASQDGNHTVTVQSEDKFGNTAVQSVNVTVDNPEPPTYGPGDPPPTFTWSTNGDTKFRIYFSTDYDFETILTKKSQWFNQPGWTVSKKKWNKILAAGTPGGTTVYWKAIGKNTGLIYLGRFTVTN